MLVKLIEVQRGVRGGTATIREVYLNPSHIISVSDDIVANQSLLTEASHLGLAKETTFSKVVIQEGTVPRSMTVVGSPSSVYKVIKRKQVLRG